MCPSFPGTLHKQKCKLEFEFTTKHSMYEKTEQEHRADNCVYKRMARYTISELFWANLNAIQIYLKI